jgi:hypothetical protein
MDRVPSLLRADEPVTITLKLTIDIEEGLEEEFENELTRLEEMFATLNVRLATPRYPRSYFALVVGATSGFGRGRAVANGRAEKLPIWRRFPRLRLSV